MLVAGSQAEPSKMDVPRRALELLGCLVVQEKSSSQPALASYRRFFKFREVESVEYKKGGTKSTPP